MKKNLPKLIFVYLFFMANYGHAQTYFPSRTDFGVSGAGAINVELVDLDEDSRLDMIVCNQSNGDLSIFRNTSSVGVINSSSFASRIDTTLGGALNYMAVTDFDGDGKKDIAVSSGATNKLYILPNKSTVCGGISFGAAITKSFGSDIAMTAGDVNADGKVDIVAANYSGNSYSVLKNTSSSGNISFASASTVSIPFSNPSQVILKDLEGDGKQDMIIFNNGGSVAVYQNTTTGGTITFSSTAVTLSANANPFRGDVADVDGDGKPDIACSNYSSNNTSIFRNTSSSGTISFSTKVDFAAAGSGYIQGTILRDLNFDGKPELIQTTGTGLNSKVCIYPNTATSGTITINSFASRVDLATQDSPTGLNVGDIDKDGKADIVSANFTAGSVSVFHNNDSTIDLNVYDTVQVTVNDTVNVVVYDTVQVTVNDTVNIVVYDTIRVSVTDTLLIEVNTTGIGQPNGVMNLVKVYPNPSSTHIYIDNGNYSQLSMFNITIINPVGQTVFQSNVNQQMFDIDISSWNEGLYLISITDQNNVSDTRKILIRR